MRRRLRERQEAVFFRTLLRATPGLGALWYAVLVLRGLLPAALAVASGLLVSAVQHHRALAGPLALVGVLFVLFQVLTPLHAALGTNLGSRTASWLNGRLLAATVRQPGIRHLEDAGLLGDLAVARDFDLGQTGPPLYIALGFIASGLVELLGGVASGALLLGFAWWAAPVLLGGWASTHWLLRESAVWRDRRTDVVRTASQHAEYAYRLAVDPAPAKELRLFGLGDWVVDRFAERRRHLYELQREATRLRERSLLRALAVVGVANAAVFAALGLAAADGRLGVARAVVFVQAAVGTSTVAFGGLSWAMDGPAAAVAAVVRLDGALAAAGALVRGTRPADGLPAREIAFRGVSFGYDGATDVLRDLDLAIPAGQSLAIVGRNGAGKTTLAKLVCRLYDPREGHVEVDGVDLRELDVDAWRARLCAVFQDYLRLELPLRDNVAPRGGDDAEIEAALAAAGAGQLAGLDTVLSRAYAGGIDLSGGQWQRVALARAIFAVRAGAGVVVLDEPTAHLDVRGEREVFARVLEATRGCTTILVSHRFSTVRLADRICVLADGRVAELGTHDELMALGGRYRRMFDLQASRFQEVDEHGEPVTYDSLA